jgi:hypothetical protein
MLRCADGYYLLNVSIYGLIMLYCPRINMLQCYNALMDTYPLTSLTILSLFQMLNHIIVFIKYKVHKKPADRTGPIGGDTSQCTIGYINYILYGP